MRLDTVPLDGMTWLYTGMAQAAEARSRVLVCHLARELDRPEAGIVLARDSVGKPMLADSPPWTFTKVNVGGDRFAVTWYTLPMDEALAIAARAEGAPNLEMT